MAYTPPEDGDRLLGAMPGPQSPRDGVPPARTGANRSALFLAAVGGVAVLAVVAIVMVVTAGGGDEDDPSADPGAVGGAVATATTVPPGNAGSMVTTTTTTEGEPEGPAAGADLPAVTIPAESSPPTTIPGSEPNSIPTDIMSGEEAPQFGTLVVDLDDGGYLDFAVQLREDQEISLLSLADDGVETAIEVFAPDGSSEGTWEGGEPGVINGLEWFLPDEPLPATGTYVIRVIHTGGSHEPFALGFFGNA